MIDSLKTELLHTITEQDLTDLHALFSMVVTHLGDKVRFKTNMERLVANPSSALIVMRQDGHIVACVIMNLRYKAGRTEAMLDEIAVSEQMRGQGIGKAIFHAAADWAKREGAELIELTSRPDRTAANAFWQALGFKQRATNTYRLNIE